jgi:hypothetical protein
MAGPLATAVVFLSPLGILLALGVLLPLAALAMVSRRGGRVRAALDLVAPPRSALAIPVVAAVAAGGLVGLAAAQPVVEQEAVRRVRSDAEAYVVFDISRSMLARRSSGSETRLERAKTAAERIREALGSVPVGVASFTDRALPHLFPTADDTVFRATVSRSIGIERPPPRSTFLTQATALDSLAAIPGERFFSPTAKKRLLVVLTDGETEAPDVSRLARQFSRPPKVDTVYVQFWGRDERVYTRGVPEAQYRPDPSARALLERVAEATGGSVYGEGDLGAAGRKARSLLGGGPTVAQGTRTSRHALAPYLVAVAVFPLGLLLWRRER